MKRRKFIINSILVGIACIVPLPKIKKKLRVFATHHINEPLVLDTNKPLAPEMLEGALHYFEHEPTLPKILDEKVVKFILRNRGD